jgi:hypothetical protein
MSDTCKYLGPTRMPSFSSRSWRGTTSIFFLPLSEFNGNSTVVRLYPRRRSTLQLQSNYHPINLKQPYQSCSAGLRSNLLLTVDKSIVLLVLSSFLPFSAFAIHSFFLCKEQFNQGFPGEPVHSFISTFVISINYTSGRFIGPSLFPLLKSTNHSSIKTQPAPEQCQK